MALVGFDDLELTTLVEPQITVVAQPTFQLGRRAGELMLDRLGGSMEPARHVVLPTELIVRQSCGT